MASESDPSGKKRPSRRRPASQQASAPEPDEADEPADGLASLEPSDRPPAEFPPGLWAQIDYLLHHPPRVIESIRQERDLGRICKLMIVVSTVTAGIYGAVMGSTNLLQGSDMALGGKFAMILIATIKVPFLFLVTLAIVCPPVYISNLFVGARHSALQIAAMLLSSVAVTSTVLASMATVALFFALTSRTYDFIKLLHVLFFVYAGWAGLRMFLTCVEGMGRGGAATTPLRVLAIWLLLYAFVGTQMAWVLRPYVGTPNMPATLFREEARRGNFYESVWRSLGNFVRGEGR